MRRRYIQHMQGVQPSEAFVADLERKMNRELRQKRSPVRVLPALAATAAVLALTVLGINVLRPKTDVVTQPPTLAQPTTASTFSPTPTPTAEPTAQPTASPTATYPPDDVRLELEMSGEAVFAASDVISNQDVLMFAGNLVGANNSSIVEICQSNELNSVVVAVLRPGTAYWPHKDASAGNIVDLTNEDGKAVGYAQRATYLDEETNALEMGWIHTVHSADPLPEASDNPVESIQLPGKAITNGTLRYGASADAPIVAVLEEGQKLGLGYRVGNWVYASTAPFCAEGETAVTGWIHISEVVGMGWRTTVAQVDITADQVNLRDAPDGKIVATLDKNIRIYYGGVTVPGKSGDWHFVTVGQFAGNVTGYISADYSRLNTFRLESELALDGVVSATLSRAADGSQTIDGDKLSLLLERLRNAYSISVCEEVCGEGSASLTLNYSDGHSVSLPVSGDGCTEIRFGDVVYDLRTDAERTEAFLNDGGADLSDILSPIFDQIAFS